MKLIFIDFHSPFTDSHYIKISNTCIFKQPTYIARLENLLYDRLTNYCKLTINHFFDKNLATKV